MGQLVSILIPCYNAARYIAAALDSALAQTWPEKEIMAIRSKWAGNRLRVGW